jgi:hypothetical protein
MIRKNKVLISLLLGFSIFASSLCGLVINFFDNLHVMTTHSVEVDHHHHDLTSLHVDHDDSKLAHQHVADYFQSLALLSDCVLLLALLNVIRVKLLTLPIPHSAFPERLFRPPQLLF